MTTTLPIALIVLALLAPGPDDDRRIVSTIVSKIQRADFEGDRDALARLRGELTPFVEAADRTFASRVLYWRGFALWRRAINGFNDSVDRQQIADDLSQCAADFKAARAADPRFVDAKAGEASCLINFAFVRMGTDAAGAREAAIESRRLVQEALAAEPDNPRALWIHGANQWYTPAERGGGQALGLATYSRALELARTQSRDRARAAQPLEPRWGEAELLMALAYANLNAATPDLAAAEHDAREALALVPYWHYVRDILLVQIEQAKSPPSRHQ